MYKLLIVDDEEIEREGMAKFIPWPDYDIELIGTAANGVEGLDKIHSSKPDIVLTDVKMPVMDGIELIKRARKDFQDIEFVVLSGYGEYEFTSQAMASGIRHYILKPCDEEKISKVIDLVKAEIDAKRSKERQQQTYKNTVKKLLPKAKSQILRNMLMGWEQPRDDYMLFLAELENGQPQLFLLTLQAKKGFDYLEYFVLENVLNELLPGAVLASTAIQNQAVFLLGEDARRGIDKTVCRVCKEFKRFSAEHVLSAVSKSGQLGEVKDMYAEIMELLRIGVDSSTKGLLHNGIFKDQKEEALLLFDFKRIQETETYNDILFECYLAFLKMRILEYSYAQKRDSCEFTVKIIYGDMAIRPAKDNDEWELLLATADVMAEKQLAMADKSASEKWIDSILRHIYCNLDNPDLSIQFLAKKILYINEDHFGRIFFRKTNQKFSAFLLRQRIELAKRVLQTDCEIKISSLAERLGFAPDGQYFSKVFRKMTGMSPKEYMDMMKKKTN